MAANIRMIGGVHMRLVAAWLPFAKVAAARQTVFAHMLETQIPHRRDACGTVLVAANQRHHIDDRLGGYARDGGAANVQNIKDQAITGIDNLAAHDLELCGPFRPMRHKDDLLARHLIYLMAGRRESQWNWRRQLSGME